MSLTPAFNGKNPNVMALQLQKRQIHMGVFTTGRTMSFPLIELHKQIDTFNDAHGTYIRLLRPRVAAHLAYLHRMKSLLDHARSLPQLYEVPEYMSEAFGRNFSIWDVAQALAAVAIARRCSPLLFDLFVAFGPDEKKLGDYIRYWPHSSPELIIPTGKYKGAKHMALAVPDIRPEDFRQDSGRIFLDISSERLIAAENFPSSSGFYPMHAEICLPYYPSMPSADNKSQLANGPSITEFYRLPGSYIGPLAFVLDANFALLTTGYGPSDIFRALVEIPKNDVNVFITQTSLARQRAKEAAMRGTGK